MFFYFQHVGYENSFVPNGGFWEKDGWLKRTWKETHIFVWIFHETFSHLRSCFQEIIRCLGSMCCTCSGGLADKYCIVISLCLVRIPCYFFRIHWDRRTGGILGYVHLRCHFSIHVLEVSSIHSGTCLSRELQLLINFAHLELLVLPKMAKPKFRSH